MKNSELQLKKCEINALQFVLVALYNASDYRTNGLYWSPNLSPKLNYSNPVLTMDSTQHGDLPRTENDGGNSWKRLYSPVWGSLVMMMMMMMMMMNPIVFVR